MNDKPRITRRKFLQASGVAAGTPLMAITGEAAAQAAAGRPVFSKQVDLRLTVNGRAVGAQIEPRVSLLDLLRERLGLPGTKKGCNEGACGACTVLMNGMRVNACMTLAASCEGAEVVTVEGLAASGNLHPVQAAFIEHDAFQCGYCTSGQVVSAVACIREGHAHDATTVREWMSGNLCRCAAYPQITAAVLDAAQKGHP